MSQTRYNVLFICTHNTARSIMAEALLRERGGDRFNAYSAGAEPQHGVNPLALETLTLAKIPTEGLHSKGLERFSGPGAPPLDFVFLVCDRASGEACPPWPGQPMTADWGVDDPARAEGAEHLRRVAFQRAFRLLDNRIKYFTALPLASLDRLSLQRRVDEIGRATIDDEAQPAP